MQRKGYKPEDGILEAKEYRKLLICLKKNIKRFAETAKKEWPGIK